MRRINLYWLLLFFLCPVAPLFSQNLIVQGDVTEIDSKLKKVVIGVYTSKGKLFHKTKTDTAGTFGFVLPLQTSEEYLVVVSKKKYVSKRFIVSTENIPSEDRASDFPVIKASISLFKPVKGVDYTLLEKPLLRYYFDPAKNNYSYDKAMLERSLQVLEKLKEEEKLKRARE